MGPYDLVYFVQDTITGLIKIGKANKSQVLVPDDSEDVEAARRKIKRRVGVIQTCCPGAIKLLGYLFAHEGAIHRRFRHLNCRHLKRNSEWFYPEKELITFIEKMLKRRILTGTPGNYRFCANCTNREKLQPEHLLIKDESMCILGIPILEMEEKYIENMSCKEKVKR